MPIWHDVKDAVHWGGNSVATEFIVDKNWPPPSSPNEVTSLNLIKLMPDYLKRK